MSEKREELPKHAAQAVLRRCQYSLQYSFDRWTQRCNRGYGGRLAVAFEDCA
jgi:hypothetical protein